MLDLRQTREYSKYMESIGWLVDGKPGSYAYIKKLPLIGSFIKIQRPQVLNEKTIEKFLQLCKKYRTFQIIIEPKTTVHCSLITGHGFRLTKSYFVPSKTILIDLIKSENQLLKEMHHKTRYNIKKSIKHWSLTINHSKDIVSFADFWQRCALNQRGMFLSQKKEIIEIYKAFSKNAYIIQITTSTSLRGKERRSNLKLKAPLSARNGKSEVLSAVLLIKAGNMAYYMFAAATPKGKKLFAPTINAWEAIKLAKKLRCKSFDFEGIYDERLPIKSWQGFTRFKRSFGGKEVEYPGTYSKFLLPFDLTWKTQKR